MGQTSFLVVGWLYEHENITNSVEVGAGAELGKTNKSKVSVLKNATYLIPLDDDYFDV